VIVQNQGRSRGDCGARKDAPYDLATGIAKTNIEIVGRPMATATACADHSPFQPLQQSSDKSRNHVIFLERIFLLSANFDIAADAHCLASAMLPYAYPDFSGALRHF
jgi:hypothetical protein